MRYIGNKTKLIPFLLHTVRRLEIDPGVACDPFAGTASVGRALKLAGWRVHCGDLLALSHVFQVARVELNGTPAFPPVEGAGRRGTHRGSYQSVMRRLHGALPTHGFVTEHYTPAGAEGRRHGRMYFTPDNARLIDGMRTLVADWSKSGLIDGRGEALLLATLVQAADRVANTTGVYASFVKTWQPNALRPIELRPIRPATPPNERSAGCTSFRGPAEELARRVGAVDLLYLDPPYNERQYPGYYHVPELLAQGWDPPPILRGKTGLIPDDDLRSEWCRRGRCEAALRSLLAASDARHILLSYNDEGLIEPDHIEAIFREMGSPDSFRSFERGYRRYRSDSDRPGRRYRGDAVRERVYYVRRSG